MSARSDPNGNPNVPPPERVRDNDPPPPPCPPRRWWQSRLGKVLLATAAALALAAAPSYLLWTKARSSRQHKSTKRGIPNENDDDGGVRIPLRDVVRFKEKQWFVEELEASREGDANSMLRLAKMYLHGQGCDKNPAMAHEWLRKARQLGVYCTLEELYAGEDWEATRAAAAAAARRALKQQEMRAGAGALRHYAAAAAQGGT